MGLSSEKWKLNDSMYLIIKHDSWSVVSSILVLGLAECKLQNAFPFLEWKISRPRGCQLKTGEE